MFDLSRRHALIELSPGAWTAILQQDRALARNSFVRDWAAAGHPVMRRRPLPEEFTEEFTAESTGDYPSARKDGQHQHLVPVGLPTPPAYGKQRIAFRVPESAIVNVRAPISLDVILASDAVPHAWRAALNALCDATDALGIYTRVFGSLMWQYLTSLPYIGPSSDVDLLWECPADFHDLDSLLQVLTRSGAQGIPRIDGEIIVNGGAVQWRELAQAASDTPLLVKTIRGSRLWARDRWLSTEAAA